MDTATRTSRTRTSLRQHKSNGADTAHRISMYSDDKDHFTPEEAYRLIMEDIRQIYTTHGA